MWPGWSSMTSRKVKEAKQSNNIPGLIAERQLDRNSTVLSISSCTHTRRNGSFTMRNQVAESRCYTKMKETDFHVYNVCNAKLWSWFENSAWSQNQQANYCVILAACNIIAQGEWLVFTLNSSTTHNLNSYFRLEEYSSSKNFQIHSTLPIFFPSW